MINLFDNYYIKIDSLNITLIKKGITKKGKTEYKNIGYHGTFKTLALQLERECLANAYSEDLFEFEQLRKSYEQKLADALYKLGLKEPKDLT